MTESNPRYEEQRSPVRSMVDRIWREGQFWGRPWWTGFGQQSMPINMYETSVDLFIVAAMPGIRAEDIEVMVTGQTLTIRSAMRGSVAETKDYLRREWYYGAYSRTIELPFAVDADKANANYADGVLTLSLPKAEATRPHRITLADTGRAHGEVEGHGGIEFSPEMHEQIESRERAEHKHPEEGNKPGPQ